MPLTQVTEFAYAKVNLALHVTGLRADGYHMLDSLVVFAGVGDRITCDAAATLALKITGPYAASLPITDDNLVLRAARLMSSARGTAITLDKHLPIASGIGGGSADAAATLRALSRLWDIPLPALSIALGADVPVCISQSPRRMQGVGDVLSAVPVLPECHLVLINPGLAVSTPDVFKALTRKDNPSMPQIPLFTPVSDFTAWLAQQRNDLQAPAMALVPEIATVMQALSAQQGCHLARMSGSGATCFGLFATQSDAAVAARGILADHPNWWVRAAPVLS